MKKFLGLATIALAFGVGSVAYAGTTSNEGGRFQVAAGQTATGGPSGGPNQAAYTVPKGATGGPSGGPNQAKYKKMKMKHKMHKH